MADRVSGAFGVFDFFAYIVPAVVLVAPLLLLPLPHLHQALDVGVVVGFLGLVLLYLLGLAVHGAGQWVERHIRLGKRGLPSSYVLESQRGPLAPPVPTVLRARIRKKFGFPESTEDATLWQAAYAWVTTNGPLHRVNQFLILSSMSRGVALALLLWVPGFVFAAWFFETPLFLGLAAGSGLAALFFDRLRHTFSESMASAVWVAFFYAEGDKDHA